MRTTRAELRERAKARNERQWTRAYKQEASEWKDKCSVATMRAHRAERSIATAKEDGANIILRQEHLPYMIEKMASALAYEYGPKINEEVSKLTRFHRGYEPWKIDLNARIDDVVRTVTIQGVVPELRYNMVVQDWR